MSDEFSDISSVAALLKDARERIKESETRSKEAIEKAEERLHNKDEELETQINSVNLSFTKWIPLLTTLQKSEDSKRNLTIILLVSFITNVAMIVMSIFVWVVKAGGKII